MLFFNRHLGNQNFAGKIQLSNSKDDFGRKKWKKTKIYFRIIMLVKKQNKNKTKNKTKKQTKRKLHL